MKLSVTLSSMAMAWRCLVHLAAASPLVAEFEASFPTDAAIAPEKDALELLPRDQTADIAESPNGKQAGNSNLLQDYIVILKDETGQTLARRSAHRAWLDELLSKRQSLNARDAQPAPPPIDFDSTADVEASKAIMGYHGAFTEAEIKAIASSEDVAFVERESYDTIQQDFVYVQYNTPWGLGRISHKSFDSPAGTDDATYVFGSQGGANTTLYVLDSGVRADHVEFTGRVRWGANYIDNEQTDVHGHGTHISGIAAGHNVGVAKFANIVAVKVIDADRRAAISNIIKGVQWIIDDAAANPGSRAVINYSAVGVISDARTLAIQKAVDAGIMVVTAAGNSAADACSYGPANMAASTDGVLTVAALNYTNTPADFSNYGGCVSVYAPGVSILSASKDAVNSYKYMSGTSMSSPYVAGLAAYFWSINSGYSLSDVKSAILNYNDGQIVDAVGNTANKIAYNHQ